MSSSEQLFEPESFEVPGRHSLTIESASPIRVPNRASLPRARSSLLGSALYQRGVQMLKDREEKAQKSFTSAYSFRPVISERSLRIVRESPRHKKALPELDSESPQRKQSPSFIERNYLAALVKFKARKLAEKPNPEDELVKACTFTPQIDTKSKKLTADYDVDLFHLAKPMREKRINNHLEYKQTKEEEELKHCTFRPNLKKPEIPKNTATFVPRQRTGKYSLIHRQHN